MMFEQIQAQYKLKQSNIRFAHIEEKGTNANFMFDFQGFSLFSVYGHKWLIHQALQCIFQLHVQVFPSSWSMYRLQIAAVNDHWDLFVGVYDWKRKATATLMCNNECEVTTIYSIVCTI